MGKRKPKPSLREQLIAKLVKRVDVTLKCEEEDIPYVGNCSAHDPETDAKQEQWIREQLESGNEWAWCTAHLIATFELKNLPGEIVGDDYLGACSYLSEEDFRTTSMYYDDMVREACGRIADQLIAAKAALDSLLK